MLNEALRLLRVHSDMKTSELAEKLGKCKSYLSEIENGKKNVTYQILEKYAAYFKMEVNEILSLAEQLEKNKDYMKEQVRQIFTNCKTEDEVDKALKSVYKLYIPEFRKYSKNKIIWNL